MRKLLTGILTGTCLLLSACGWLGAGNSLQGFSPPPTSISAPTETAVVPLAAQPDSQPTAPIETLIPTTAPAEEVCRQQGGVVKIGSISSDLLPQELDFRVYLPPCYEEEPERHYPVLYLIHGQSFQEDQWDRIGVDEAINSQVAAGTLPPFLVVMPRDRVWTQPNQDKFGDALVQELIPYIDATYRTLPERAYRAIGGLSRGAGWAVHLGLTDWQQFGAFGAHSLALFHYDARYLHSWLDAIPADAMPRIFLDVGERDRPEIIDSAKRFEQILTEKLIPHEWYLFQGYHNEEYWRAHLLQYLRWYSQGWENIP